MPLYRLSEEQVREIESLTNKRLSIFENAGEPVEYSLKAELLKSIYKSLSHPVNGEIVEKINGQKKTLSVYQLPYWTRERIENLDNYNEGLLKAQEIVKEMKK